MKYMWKQKPIKKFLLRMYSLYFLRSVQNFSSKLGITTMAIGGLVPQFHHYNNPLKK